MSLPLLALLVACGPKAAPVAAAAEGAAVDGTTAEGTTAEGTAEDGAASAASPFAPSRAGAAFSGDPVERWFPNAVEQLQGCTVDGQAGVAVVLQVSCPGDRVLTDMRGPGVPDPGRAVDSTMQTLAQLGLESSPRQQGQELPPQEAAGASPGTATVIDARGPDLELTVWVVHHMGAMPQVLSCMALASDAEATTWCPAALAAMLGPPGPELPLRFMEMRLDDAPTEAPADPAP